MRRILAPLCLAVSMLGAGVPAGAKTVGSEGLTDLFDSDAWIAETISPDGAGGVDHRFQLKDSLGGGGPSAGRLAEIEVRLQEAVRTRPGDGAAQRDLAYFYLATNRPQAGLPHLRKAYGLDPSDARLGLDIARVERALGGLPAARAALQSLAAEAPDPFPFTLALQQIDFESGARDAALAGLRGLLETDLPAERRVLCQLLLTRYLVDLERWDEASAMVDRILAAAPDREDALAFRIAFLLRDGHDQEGRALLTRTLGQFPANPTLLQLAAREADRDGETGAALSYLKRAAVAADYAPGLVLDYAAGQAQAGDRPAAAGFVRDALLRRPGQPEFLVVLGQLQLDMGEWAGAEGTARDLRLLGTEAALRDSEMIRVGVLKGRGEREAATELLHDLSQGGSDVGAAAAYIRDLVAQGRLDAAADYLDGIRATAPDNPAALLMRASIHQLQGQPDAAESLLRQAVAQMPNSPAAHLALGRNYMDRGDLARAEAALRAGLKVMPGQPRIQMALAEVLLRADRPAEAADLMRDLSDRFAGNLLLVNNYASIVADYLADASTYLEDAVRRAAPLKDAELPEFRDTYGWLLHRTGQTDRSLPILEAVAAERPDNPWVNYHLASALTASGQKDRARPYLERASQSSDPTFTRGADVARMLGGH